MHNHQQPIPENLPGPDAPWDEPCFIIAPGRYYDRMGSISLPRCYTYPFGGDMTYLIWRYDHTPGEWICTFRIRIYAGPNTDPFTGGDRKQWNAFQSEDIEKHRKAIVIMETAAKAMLNGGQPVRHDIIKLEGDCDVFWRIMEEAKPDWLHLGEKITLPKK